MPDAPDVHEGMLATQNPNQAASPALGGAGIAIQQSASVARAQAAYIMAIQRPRDITRARDRIVMECARPKLAEVGIYTYPKGGKDISGPSIRLAEVAARNFGNLEYGFNILARHPDSTEAEAYCLDLENNVRATIPFVVKHVRDTRKESKPLTDERDIYELVANYASRRVRACILRIIPGDVIEEAQAACEETQKASLKGKDMGTVIKEMLGHFEPMGVGKEHIEKRLGHRLDPKATTPGEILNLRKVYSVIKDGFSGPEDWFDMSAEAVSDLNAMTPQANAADQQDAHEPAICPIDQSPVDSALCDDCTPSSQPDGGCEHAPGVKSV